MLLVAQLLVLISSRERLLARGRDSGRPSLVSARRCGACEFACVPLRDEQRHPYLVLMPPSYHIVEYHQRRQQQSSPSPGRQEVLTAYGKPDGCPTLRP